MITPETFTSQDDYDRREIVLRCSCAEAEVEHKLITKAPICFASTNKLDHFAASRREKYCFHLLAAVSETFLVQDLTYKNYLRAHEHDDDEEYYEPVIFLSDKPRLIAVHDGMTWGVMGPFGVKNGLVCFLSTCRDMQNRCTHLKKYLGHCEERDIDPELFTAGTEEPQISVLSSQKIPFFPLPIELAHTNHMLSSGLLMWPAQIRPETFAQGHCYCESKNSWKSEEKIGVARIFTPGTIVTKTLDGGVAKDIEVYVGKTEYCSCQLSADCQSLTLINVDNRYA